MKLVIVESPSKAKTISKYLGKDFKVLASYGHVRALPSKTGSVLPEKDFFMRYESIEKSKKHFENIISWAQKADAIILATDYDREGEAISWHIFEMLKNEFVSENIFKRIIFNEVTEQSILKALTNPKEIDQNLVNAQKTRQALDYLVGFSLSPILWRKLPGCRSAGRVQSVTLRLVCDREQEIESFISEEYWSIEANFENTSNESFISKLTHVNKIKLEKLSIKNKLQANQILDKLKDQSFFVQSVEKKRQKKNPLPPFITSSLQQEASRKLGFSPKKTMQIAQKLYEGLKINTKEITGLITYMRTDSYHISSSAVTSIRKLILSSFGKDYLSEKICVYKSKSKNAQEAHEAIRPTDVFREPDQMKDFLDKDQFALYDLIWRRTIASQMSQALIDITSVVVASANKEFLFKSTGSIIFFEGFYKMLYHKGRTKKDVNNYEEENLNHSSENNFLPKLEKGEILKILDLKTYQHFTEGPPSYNEASIIKKLEELGIGRPSTYASTISVLLERKYIIIEKKKIIPTSIGRLLNIFLASFFKKYVEYEFTAQLEEDLDKISIGKFAYKDLLRSFWNGLEEKIENVNNYSIQDVVSLLEKDLHEYLFKIQDISVSKSNMEKDAISNTTPRYSIVTKCKLCKKGDMRLKLSKFGPFLACSNYPECEFTRQILTRVEKNQPEENSNLSFEKSLGRDSLGNNIFLKNGPYGFYIEKIDNITDTTPKKRTTKKKSTTINKKKKKPLVKRFRLPNNIKHTDLDLNMAIKLLSFPLRIGEWHSENSEEKNSEIILNVGRFGPYLKYKNLFYSIPNSVDYLNISLTQAIEIIKNKISKKNKNKNST